MGSFDGIYEIFLGFLGQVCEIFSRNIMPRGLQNKQL